MKTRRHAPCVLLLAASAGLAGCGVGDYHIPPVEPVVKPEPEEDLFKDLDFDNLESDGESGDKAPGDKAPGDKASGDKSSEADDDKAGSSEAGAEPSKPAQPKESPAKPPAKK